MFKLTAVIDGDAFTSLPETIDPKELFQKDEKNDNYVLAMDGGEAAKLAKPLQDEVTRLKAHNETVLGEKDAIQAKFKPFEELGKTPQELEDLISDKVPADVVAITETHKSEINSLRLSAEASVKAAEDKVKSIDSLLQTTLQSTAIDKAIRDTSATPLAYDYLLNRTKIIKMDGSDEYVVRILDESGEIAYKAGQPMTPAQLLEDKKTDPIYGGMFFAGDAGGTGGTNQSGTGISKTGTIKAADAATFGANLDKIASGEVKVVGLQSGE